LRTAKADNPKKVRASVPGSGTDVVPNKRDADLAPPLMLWIKKSNCARLEVVKPWPASVVPGVKRPTTLT
jgi:hypothetical protein